MHFPMRAGTVDAVVSSAGGAALPPAAVAHLEAGVVEAVLG